MTRPSSEGSIEKQLAELRKYCYELSQELERANNTINMLNTSENTKNVLYELPVGSILQTYNNTENAGMKYGKWQHKLTSENISTFIRTE